ncbi:MAG: hypothetical protein JNM37_14175 [Rhodocyclaceae bacterium]|nr:hypothetical protein [Rhodocyclaceae bacterium]
MRRSNATGAFDVRPERKPPAGGQGAGASQPKTHHSKQLGAYSQSPVDGIGTDSQPRYGATPDEWDTFAYVIGLTPDLLPVVSNPRAIISPGSDLKEPGKTPSQYNVAGHVAGLANWTKRVSTDRDVERWANQADNGICVQTRCVRAIDVDVSDPILAAEIRREIVAILGFEPPCRTRPNSSKFLFAITLPGEYTKRIIRTKQTTGEFDKAGNPRRHIVEFLAEGQQFIAAGTHPSGARYEWLPALPLGIPEVTPEQFEGLWFLLAELFGAESAELRKSTGALVARKAADAKDPLVDWLFDKWEVLTEDSRTGRLDITCPFEDEHSGESSKSATSYFPAGIGGYERGHFKCQHAHCANRTDAEFIAAIGDPVLDSFDIIEGEAVRLPADDSGIADLLGGAPVAPKALPDASRDPREEFFAHLQDNKFVFRPTGVLYSAAGVDNGYLPINGVKPSKWLGKNRPVHQLTWHPGKPELIEGELIASGESRDAPGRRAYNLYQPPQILPGNPADIGPWLDHLRTIYPDEQDHIVKWFAHRVQRPGEKLNHALVLGGAQGIGKDSILEPLKRAVGHSNFNEIDPEHALGNFNTFVRAVVLRVNEARDLGNANDRFRLYERFKTIIAAPPDVLRINEKHISEYPIVNVVGVVYTTNHAVDGLYLPAEDRRHYVAWSGRRKEEFPADYWRGYWAWLNGGGWRNVAAYLRALPLDDFDPKADPPKTQAFYAIVNAGRDPEDGELLQALHEMGNPDAVTVGDVLVALNGWRTVSTSTGGSDDWDSLIGTLAIRGNRRRLPHLFERAGYLQVANSYATDRLWRLAGKRVAIYARSTLPNNDRYRAAKQLAENHKCADVKGLPVGGVSEVSGFSIVHENT